jgi:hypothetical protein
MRMKKMSEIGKQVVSEEKVAASIQAMMKAVEPLNLHETVMALAAVIGSICYGSDINRSQYGDRYRLIRLIIDKYMGTAIADFDELHASTQEKMKRDGHTSGTA